MIINPITLIENGWIAHPLCKTIDDWKKHKFLSPNAIDFTLDRVFAIHNNDDAYIANDTKSMRNNSEVHPIVTIHKKQCTWDLNGSVYDCMSDLYIELPPGVAATLIIRSTFNRNGIFLTSGLYDSGFKGNIGFVLHNRSGLLRVEPGTRIGQIKFEKSEDTGIVYEGGYNTEQGKHWTEK